MLLEGNVGGIILKGLNSGLCLGLRTFGVWAVGEVGTYTTGEIGVLHLLYSLDNRTLSFGVAELNISEVPLMHTFKGLCDGWNSTLGILIAIVVFRIV